MRDGVVLVGTAHVSATSVRTVEEAIRERRPDRVLVELDPRRYEALRDPEAWQKTDIIQVLREKKQHLFLLQLYLANMQARVGRETGVSPGMDMLRAVQVADEVGAEVVLIDRDVGVTLKRGFGSLGFWERLRLFWNVWLEVLTPAKANEGRDDKAAEVDALLETDAITAMTDEFARFAPKVKTALIDERDAYMASHIDEQAQDGRSVLAVVGAGHVAGIRRHLAGDRPDRAPLEELPRKRFGVGKALGILVPAVILGMFGLLLWQGDYAKLRDALLEWVVINGALSALGALLAGGHILSALVAFVAAPITSVNPTLAAGWFAGLTEAKLRTPTVGDFQEIRDIETFRAFWSNGVVRIILVTALTNLGSTIGTYVAGTRIFNAVF